MRHEAATLSEETADAEAAGHPGFISMTVCIAAMCENGKKIVTATDGLVTLGGVTADLVPGKFRWFCDWLISLAGSTGNAGLFLEELRLMELADPTVMGRNRIQETLRFAYNSFRSKLAAHSVLGPRDTAGRIQWKRCGTVWRGECRRSSTAHG